MNFQAAINTALILSIVAHSQVTAERAAQELRIAKKTAKTLGLSLADTLRHLGLVA